MKNINVFICLTLLLVPGLLLANTELGTLQLGWANASYKLHGEHQEKVFEQLIKQANYAVKKQPKSAEILIWRGIIKSSFAGIKGGLSALSLINESKSDFEQALSIDAGSLAGSAYTSLGTLYFKAPGWPISFGDDDKAELMLKKALLINPKGIDSNYFYAEFLRDQGDYRQAKKYLLKAQSSAKRPNRPVADMGRQDEISQALLEVGDELK